jgi:N utilization substance protein B
MSNRHLARTIAMQTIYQWDFNSLPKTKLDETIAFHRQEFAPNFNDAGYVKETVEGLMDRLPEIDEQIAHFAPSWPLSTMTYVDRSILRLGTYELVFSEHVPSKVAINEAIELAITFGGEASGRFVNGVLGAMYKDMVDKGKLKEADRSTPTSDL